MTVGPVEYVIVEFPGNKFKGEIVPALRELTANRTIRIIDLVFIKKDQEGNVSMDELSALDPEEAAVFAELNGEIYDLLNEEDILLAATKLANNSSAALLIYEHAWVTRLRDAVVNAGGRLVESDRIAPEIVEAAMAAALNSGVASPA